MKKLLLLFLFSGSLDGFSQDIKKPCSHNLQNCKCMIVDVSPDTLRAELLVTYTTARWSVAHCRPGYIVRKDGKVIRFLTDKKQRFPPTTRLWGWMINDEKVMP